MSLTVRYLAVASLCVLCSGCATGYNRLLFATRTNIGVDADTKPPTLEVAISRDEGIIEPQFEGGKTVPAVASFRSNVRGPMRILTGVSSSFATGAAADGMTDLYGDEGGRDALIKYHGIHLSQEPVLPDPNWWNPLNWPLGIATLLGSKPSFQKDGEVRPIFFGTQSSLGLKVNWDGTAAQYPSAVKFGYNRKELAYTPITAALDGEVTDLLTAILEGRADRARECALRIEPRHMSTDKARRLVESARALPAGGPIAAELTELAKELGERKPWLVDTASLLATVDTDVQAADNAELKYLQYFATGPAAENLVRRQGVRSVMLKRLSPDGKAPSYADLAAENGDMLAAITSRLERASNDEAKRKLVGNTANQTLVALGNFSAEPLADGADFAVKATFDELVAKYKTLQGKRLTGSSDRQEISKLLAYLQAVCPQ